MQCRRAALFPASRLSSNTGTPCSGTSLVVLLLVQCDIWMWQRTISAVVYTLRCVCPWTKFNAAVRVRRRARLQGTTSEYAASTQTVTVTHWYTWAIPSARHATRCPSTALPCHAIPLTCCRAAADGQGVVSSYIPCCSAQFAIGCMMTGLGLHVCTVMSAFCWRRIGGLLT